MTVEEIKERNIENVLREATRLFAEIGPEHTSTEMIAAAAHVTRRSVLNYFPSKNLLIRRVLDLSMQSVGGELEAYLHTQTFLALNGREQLMGILRFFFDMLATHHEYINSMTEMALSLRRNPDSTLRPEYTYITQCLSKSLHPAYQKGLADGSICHNAVLQEELLDSVALSLRGLFRQMAFMMQDGSMEERAFAREIARQYLMMIRAALLTPLTQEQMVSP